MIGHPAMSVRMNTVSGDGLSNDLVEDRTVFGAGQESNAQWTECPKKVDQLTQCLFVRHRFVH
jgi:hypothetical protein